MKKLFTSAIIFFLSLGLLTPKATAQDDARPAWQIAAFDISANVLQSERALAAVATLTIKNVGRGSGSGLTLRLNSKAKVKSVTANGAAASYSVLADARPGLQRLNITMPSPLAPSATVNLSVDYRITVERNSGLEAISPLGSQFLPLTAVSAADPSAGGWYPMLNTPFTVRSTDMAPFKLRVEGANVISSGSEKESGGTAATFDQPLNGQPFFLQGVWERAEGSGEAKGITAFLAAGASADERKQAEVMLTVAASARSFYSNLLGPAPAIPIRLVAVRRGAGFNDAGTLLIERGAFRRAKLDAATAMLIAESVARLWVGGQTPVRGEGSGVVKDGLSRYLATLFLEKQFGREIADAELQRERAAYATVARRDAPLSRSTPLDDSYFSGVPNKSTMVWRLVERRLGRDAFLATLRSVLQNGSTDQTASLATLRGAIASRGDEALKKLVDHEMDQSTEMDLMVGVPQQRGAEWVAALRNLGTTDAQVTVIGTTDRGEQIRIETTIPGQNFADAVFKTTAKIVRVEVDPDKLYPQLDYANDVAPRVRDVGETLAEASRFFGAQDFGKTEAAAREIMAAVPRMQEARILLARALLGQNKLDEADKLFRAALDDVLPTAVTLAWANIGLGEIALKKGQTPEAVRRFNEAVRAEGEYASALAARAGRIRAESSGGTSPPIDETVRTFVSQLEKDITAGSKAALENKIVPGELGRFVNGILGTRPDSWQTRVLRTEQLDAVQAAADVAITSKVLGKESSGTAVLILARVGSSWKLAGIDLFEVR
jgi:hypothetical protein